MAKKAKKTTKKTVDNFEKWFVEQFGGLPLTGESVAHLKELRDKSQGILSEIEKSLSDNERLADQFKAALYAYNLKMQS
jgi:hypothetical protein